MFSLDIRVTVLLPVRKIEGKVVPGLNYLSIMPWRSIEEWWYSSTILDLGGRWGWGFSFRPLPFYPRGKSLRYPLDRRLGGPQSRSGQRGEEKKSYIVWNPTQALQPFAMSTPLLSLRHIHEKFFPRRKKWDSWIWVLDPLRGTVTWCKYSEDGQVLNETKYVPTATRAINSCLVFRY
jgi:hypothetical protein